MQLDDVTTSTTASATPTNAGIIALVGLVVFIASFAFSLGPGRVDDHQRDLPGRTSAARVSPSRPAPTGSRAWLVSQFFLTLVDSIGEDGTFWLFAGFCAVTFVYVRWFVPETKGKTLEEVEQMWGDEAELRAAISTWE